MATGFSSLGSLMLGSTFLQSNLQCPVCLETFDEPKLLACGHTFCRQCLQDICGRILPTHPRSIRCPTCRGTTAPPNSGVPDTWVNDLQTNYALTSMIESIRTARRNQNAMAQAGQDEVGSQQVDGSDDDLMTLGDVNDEHLFADAADGIEVCTRHSNNSRELFCLYHRLFLCEICIRYHNKECPIVPIDVLVEDRAKMREDGEAITNFLTSLRGQLNECGKELQKNQSAVISQFASFRQRLSTLKGEMNSLIDHLSASLTDDHGKTIRKELTMSIQENNSLRQILDFVLTDFRSIYVTGTPRQQYIAQETVRKQLDFLELSVNQAIAQAPTIALKHSGIDALEGILKAREFLEDVQVRTTFAQRNRSQTQ